MLKTFQLYPPKAVQPKCVPASQSWNWPEIIWAVVLNSPSSKTRGFCLFFFSPSKETFSRKNMYQRRLEDRRERQKEGLEKMWHNERLNFFNLFILSKNKFMGDVISLIILTRGKC